MHDILEPILPQVPIEGITLHIGRSGLSMGDAAEARMMADGRVGVWARVKRPVLGIVPRRRDTRLGHLGPVAGQILTSALEEGAPLRLRFANTPAVTRLGGAKTIRSTSRSPRGATGRNRRTAPATARAGIWRIGCTCGSASAHRG